MDIAPAVPSPPASHLVADERHQLLAGQADEVCGCVASCRQVPQKHAEAVHVNTMAVRLLPQHLTSAHAGWSFNTSQQSRGWMNSEETNSPASRPPSPHFTSIPLPLLPSPLLTSSCDLSAQLTSPPLPSPAPPSPRAPCIPRCLPGGAAEPRGRRSSRPSRPSPPLSRCCRREHRLSGEHGQCGEGRAAE